MIARGLWRERKAQISEAQETFQSSETILYATVIVGT